MHEDLFIGHAALEHLGVDTRALLEHGRDVMDIANCADGQNRGMSSGGVIGRLMLSKQDCIVPKEKGAKTKRSDLQAENKKTFSS